MSTIHLITVPIGNMNDLTPRARKVLEEQSSFLAEDTRRFFDLLARLGIDRSNKFASPFHDHTQEDAERLIKKMDDGEDLYIVSDAGSPIISDPAYPLVKLAIEHGHEVETCPGVSAVTTALELSGLPPHPFYFHGFIAREKNKISESFLKAGAIKGTHIFFESPNRILDTLNILKNTLPDADVAVARELTKTFQSVYRFKASKLDAHKDEIVVKGEFVLVFYNDQEISTKDSSKLVEMVDEYLYKKGSPKLLAKIFAEITDKNSKEIYKVLTESSR